VIPTPGSAPSAQAEADAVGAALLLIVGGIALAMLVAALHRSGSPPVRLILGLAWALQLAAAAPILFFGYSAVRLATSAFSEDDEIYS
jgi:membrane protein implicated in regulation of membrane protease activity